MAQAQRGTLAVAIAAIALASGATLFAYYDRVLTEPRQLAMRVAQISPALAVALGEPLHFGRFPQAKLHGGNGESNADMAISVSGPLGSGKLIEWAQQSGGQWRLCSLVFRPDAGGARSLDLVDSGSTHCETE
jgi:hypothetical protein